MEKSPPSKALIDGDILSYRCGFAAEKEEAWVAKHYLNKDITMMTDAVECSNFNVYLTSTDKSNFRFELSPEYKANRKSPKPKYYEMLREIMREEYGAIVVDGKEADDQMGEDSVFGETIICSIDKDLDQIPGWHYNFVKKTRYFIGPLEATRWFYQQMLIGDVSDNVRGCRGIGAVKANNMLEGATSENEMFETVLKAYQSKEKKNWEEKFLLAGHLLWIRQAKKPKWQFPNGAVASKSALEDFLTRLESDSNLNPTA